MNNQKNVTKKKRILMLGNSHLVIFGFRGELIARLSEEGYDVVVSFPNGPFGNGEETSKMYGCKFVEIPMARRGVNPIQEMSLLLKYIRLIKEVNPDIVLAFTVKCDIYGGMACKRLGVPYIPNITGLGKALSKKGFMQSIATMLYRVAMRSAECICFQNSYDKEYFDRHKIQGKHYRVLPGSGVNLEKFIPLEYPTDDVVRYMYIARVMKAKGIEQFIEAAKIIKEKYPLTEFHVCGYCEEEHYSDMIKAEEQKGVIIYHGLVHNIIDYEKKVHCVVLPSFHPEGVSNVLLEAAACARPIITTDRAGCRETVDDGITGFLVQEKDSKDLAEKMEKFLRLSFEEKREMGLRGRQKVEKEFDRQIVVDAYLQEIKKAFAVGG